MSTSNLSLWINPQNNTIISGWNSLTQSPQIVLTQGDDVFVDIHMVDFSGGESIEIPFPLGASIKCAIGRLDRFPTEGNFVFEYGLDSVTIPIASSILDVNNLINSMPSIVAEGGVTVYFVNSTTYRIVFNTTGSKQGCSVDASGLYPSSTATVTVITGGSSSINEVQHVKLKATPVAYSDTFTLAGTPSISIQELTTSIFRISISDILKYGNFTISNGTKTTAAISWSASGSEILSALTLAGISTTSGVVGSVQYSVTKNDTLSWDISRISGTYESLSVSPIGFIGFSTMTGALNMNTIEVEDLLGGAARVAAILEVEMTAGPLKQTLYQGSINVANDLIDNASYSPIQFPSVGGIPEAPIDGFLYGRINGNWSIVPEADLSGYATQQWVNSQGYVMINGWGTVPDGGLAGQVLAKLSDDNYMYAWTSLPDFSGYATQSWVTSQGYITSTALIPYITSANAALTYQPIGNYIDLYYADNKYQTIIGMGSYATNNYVSTFYAPLASPALTGVPTAPTPLALDNSTTIATTAFVANAVASSTTSASTSKVTETVRNATLSTITAGSVVYISGANGTHPTIQLAQANSESTSYRTFGVAQSDIPPSTDGVVVIIGEVANINTGSFNDGDQLYLSPTVAGGITNVKPSAPNHLVYVGVCTRANNNNGTIEVKVINGFEVEELHNAAISNRQNGDIFSWDSVTGLWENQSASVLGIAELSGATFSGKVNFSQPTTTSASVNLGVASVAPSSTVAGDIWIGTNINFRDNAGTAKAVANTNTSNTFTQPQIVSTGVTTTSAALRVTQLGTGNAFVIEDGSTVNPDTTSFVIDSSGNVGIGMTQNYTPVGKLDVNGLITSSTATAGTSSAFVATTAFVKNAVVPQILNLSLTGFPYATQIGWNTVVRIDGGNEMPIELPTDFQNNVAIGTQIVFIQSDVGQLNFTPMYGATVISSGNKMKTSGQYSVATAIKIAASEWLIAGDLTT